MNPEALGPSPRAAEIADEIVASLHASTPAKEGGTVRYPGEQTLRVRAENEKLGLPVEPGTGRRFWRCEPGPGVPSVFCKGSPLNPYSENKFLVFIRLQGACRSKVLTSLELSADSSFQTG